MQSEAAACVKPHDSTAASNILQEAVLFVLCVAEVKELFVVMSFMVRDMTGWLGGRRGRNQAFVHKEGSSEGYGRWPVFAVCTGQLLVPFQRLLESKEVDLGHEKSCRDCDGRHIL